MTTAAIKPEIVPGQGGTLNACLRRLLREALVKALVRSSDREIFAAARDASVIVMTRDVAFAVLLEENGPPPSLLWITCGKRASLVISGSPINFTSKPPPSSRRSSRTSAGMRRSGRGARG